MTSGRGWPLMTFHPNLCTWAPAARVSECRLGRGDDRRSRSSLADAVSRGIRYPTSESPEPRSRVSRSDT